LRAIGCLLMVSGWLIVMAAMVLLTRLPERFGFVLAGLAVEVLGLLLLAQRYRAMQLEEKRRR
jgi:uncharacterized membrane-anchored protein